MALAATAQGLPALEARSYAGPHAASNWVLPGRLIAGGYPGSRDEEEHDSIVTSIMQCGVTTFVCLQPKDELERFRAYGPVARRLNASTKIFHAPIDDLSVTTDAAARSAADTIARLLERGEVVYVHCWGGHGRTGTIVSILLGRLFRVGAQAAIDHFVAAHKLRRAPLRGSFPQSSAQLEQALRLGAEAFGEGEGAATELQLLDLWAPPAHPQLLPLLSSRLVAAFGSSSSSSSSSSCTGRASGKLGSSSSSLVGSRCRGSLLGLALGDALGTAVEFCPPGSFEPLSGIVGGGKFQLLAGQWTDDTSLALCLAQSLVRCGGACDGGDQLTVYAEWLRAGHLSSNGRFIDVGRGTKAAIDAWIATSDTSATGGGEARGGNGSLMRLAPISILLAGATDLSALEKACVASSVTTHAHVAAVDTCRYFGLMLYAALEGASKEDLLACPFSAPMGSFWARTDARGICQTLCADVAAVAGGSYKSREPPEIHGGAFAPISLEAALWAFHRSASFAEGALLAANLGDDADTTAAIYGMLAGAYYGEKGLPADWLQTLFFGPLIGAAADALRGLAAAARREVATAAAADGAIDVSEGGVAQAKAAEKVATKGASEEECAASFLRLVDVQTLVETRYAAVRGKLSPGPGPPMAWPGGYKSVAAFEAAIEEIEREVAERGEALHVTEGASALLGDWRRQWTEDARLLGAALERAPRVGAMLAQIQIGARGRASVRSSGTEVTEAGLGGRRTEEHKR